MAFLHSLVWRASRFVFACTALLTFVPTIAPRAEANGIWDPSRQYQTLSADPEFVIPTLDEFRRQNADKDWTESQRFKYWNQHRSAVLAKRRQVERQVISDLRIQDMSNRDLFERWFRGYVFPSWSSSDPDSLGALDGKRRRFMQIYLRRTPRGAARDEFVDELIIPDLQSIVAGDFHPAVRINALIVLCDLNRVEGVRGESMPVPHPDLLEYLNRLVAAPAIPDALKIVALGGIKRHLSLRSPDNNLPIDALMVDSIAENALRIMSSSISDWADESSWQWVLRRSFHVVALLPPSSLDQSIDTQLMRWIEDTEAPMPLRMDAVKAVCQRIASSGFSADHQHFGFLLGNLVADTAENEAQLLMQWKRDIQFSALLLDGRPFGEQPSTISSPSGVGPDRGGVSPEGDPASGDEQESDEKQALEFLPAYRTTAVKRKLRDVTLTAMVCLVGQRTTGDGGLAGLIPNDETKTRIERLAEEIDQLREILDDETRKDQMGVEFGQRSRADKLSEQLTASAIAIRHSAQALASGAAKNDAAKGER